MILKFIDFLIELRYQIQKKRALQEKGIIKGNKK